MLSAFCRNAFDFHLKHLMFKGIVQMEQKLTLSQLPFFELPGTVPFALNLTHLKGY